MTETQTSEREERWTIYTCKHVRHGDFGPRADSLEPPKMSCADCETVEVVPATLLTEALEALDRVEEYGNKAGLQKLPALAASTTSRIRAKLSDTKEAG